MDWSDLMPIVPPNLPGERSSALTPGQRFLAGIGTTLLPTIGFLLVLLSGFAARAAIALAVIPILNGTLVFVLCRRFATPLAWALLFALGSAAFCLIGDSCALLLRGLARLFNALG
jgi:hypothetical protein